MIYYAIVTIFFIAAVVLSWYMVKNVPSDIWLYMWNIYPEKKTWKERWNVSDDKIDKIAYSNYDKLEGIKKVNKRAE